MLSAEAWLATGVWALAATLVFIITDYCAKRFNWWEPILFDEKVIVVSMPEPEDDHLPLVAQNDAGEEIKVPDKFTFTLRTDGKFATGRMLLDMNWDPEFILTLREQGIDHVSEHECVVDFLVMISMSMINQGADETDPDRISPVDKANRIVK